MKTLSAYKALIFVAAASLCSTPMADEKTVQSYSSPESVLLTDRGIFVSNVGEKLEPQREDADGAISLIGEDGHVISRDYFDVTLNAPKGMAVIDDTLYVTDIDRVVGMSITTKKKIYEVSLQKKEVGFLNDLATDKNGLLYASATDTGDIFVIDPANDSDGSQISRLPIAKLPGPNGLAYDAVTHSLWIASFGENNQPNGEIGHLNLASLNYKPLQGAGYGMFDGIALVNDKTLLISDWVGYEKVGLLKKIDIQTGESSTLAGQMGGPADFSYSAKTRAVYMPKMMESDLLIIDVN